jgi:hypothetical protein
MPTGKTTSMRRTHVQDPLVRKEVEDARRRFAAGEATISLAEIVRERRAKKSDARAIGLPHSYVISEYEH